MKKIRTIGTIKLNKLSFLNRIKLIIGMTIENQPVVTYLDEEEYNRIVLEDERFIQMQDNLTKLVNIAEKLMENGNQ